MAIVDTLELIKTNLANAYDIAESKGATIPENRNMENLASTIESVQGGGGDGNYKALLDGSLEKFKVPAGVTSLASYRFYGFKNLKEVDLTGITIIPHSLCEDCSYIEKLILDKNTTRIEGYAFRQTGNVGGVAGSFEFHPVNSCYLNSNAFQTSKLSKISGEFNGIMNNALSDNTNYLTDINIKINGAIGSYSFSNNLSVKNFYLDPESVVTSLGNYAFRNFALTRENPENNIFQFDFRNSTFNTVNYACFECSTTGRESKYFDIQFHDKVSILNGNIFKNCDHFNIYFNTPTVPTATSSTFADMTNFKVFVPYNLLNTYKTATNWVTIASNIYGFVNENTLEAGYVLPTTNGEGLTLKWYSDIDMTTEVTAVADTTIKYYCGVVE